MYERLYKEDVNNLVMRIQDDLTATTNEPLSTVRDLPKMISLLKNQGK